MSPDPPLKRALIADDEDAIRDFCSLALGRLGFEVVLARSVGEARATIAAQGDALDLVVIDLVLPDGSGKDIHDALVESTSEAAVLLSSGYDAHEVLPLLGSTCAFLPKPYTLAELAEGVAQAFEVSGKSS